MTKVPGFGEGEILSRRFFDGVEWWAVRIGCHIVFAKATDCEAAQ